MSRACRVSARLPDFPWDRLGSARRRAAAHPGRDRRPLDRDAGRPDARSGAGRAPVRGRRARLPAHRGNGGAAGRDRRLADPADARPSTSPQRRCCRRSARRSWSPRCRCCWARPRRHGGRTGARLPDLRGRCPPRRSGRRPVATRLLGLGPAAPRLIWLNSPANPTGRVLPSEHLAKMVAWARERGTAGRERRVLPRVRLGPRRGLRARSGRLRWLVARAARGALAVQAVQPRGLPGRLRRGRPRGGRGAAGGAQAHRLIVPTPVQAAMTAALDDDAHVAEQRRRYLGRRRGAPGRVAQPPASGSSTPRVRCTCGPPGTSRARDSVGLARGTRDPGRARRLLRPGRPPSVRVALTATDERVAAAANRLLPIR